MEEYSEEWLKAFDGTIKPDKIDMCNLTNSIEKYVSQFEYVYKTDLKDYDKITIKVLNTNIPHLMGISRNHHVGLPTTQGEVIFEGLKKDWTLKKLMDGDKRWFAANKEKLIGCIFLYQMLNIIECSVYTTINSGRHKRLERDNIYFIIFKYPGSNSYSIELTPENNSDGKVYTPRSLKINDEIERYCKKIDLKLVDKRRIKSNKKRIYKKW